MSNVNVWHCNRRSRVMTKPNSKVRFQFNRFITNFSQSNNVFVCQNADKVVRSFGRRRNASVGSHKRVCIGTICEVVRVVSLMMFACVRVQTIEVVRTVPIVNAKIVMISSQIEPGRLFRHTGSIQHFCVPLPLFFELFGAHRIASSSVGQIAASDHNSWLHRIDDLCTKSCQVSLATRIEVDTQVNVRNLEQTKRWEIIKKKNLK